MLKRISCNLALAASLVAIYVHSPVHAQLRADHSSGINQQIREHALSFVGICELTGKNDGPVIEAIIASVGAPKGSPYCAAFVDSVLRSVGLISPRSAWSPSFFPKARRIMYAHVQLGRESPQVGDVCGYYFPRLKRIGHVGLMIGSFGDFYDNVEANTSDANTGEGLRNGGCILRKKVQKRRIYALARWKDIQ